MYVCICNAVTDSDIREAYLDGAQTFEQQQERLCVSTCCGCCEPFVREILSVCRADEAVQNAPLLAMPRVAAPSMG